jgi:hypothetical protein
VRLSRMTAEQDSMMLELIRENLAFHVDNNARFHAHELIRIFDSDVDWFVFASVDR